MTVSNHLLDRIERTPDVRELLRSSFAFDTSRRNGDGLRLASGAPLEPIAGEFAGGTYFLCPEEDGRRPVVYASSEGEGGLMADDLADALEIIVGLDWMDCLSFSGGGDAAVMQVSAQHLERHLARDNPEIAEERARVAEALSLRIVPVADLVVRLHTAASRTVPEYVVTTEDGEEYGPLFGVSTEPRLGGWD
ncbi:hypothetical protein OEIGOIKO_01355 [Streptomyces chrestomyceticus JCM 4735]|uniref:Uncharacterized protein n=1 Tax=Streptomyces chrestomyceticus JCM 4735 TaxID=1306181 RepID=A0A7U9KRQ9_9ACTN|nr:hypothetical protein [Streptomyces chrestomyceticus]GCD33632.1 hypothetical protein OEIGOIKO_01355 [Streptomyces chrestomyceticus JCM 4735]